MNANKYINLTYLKELSNGSNQFITEMIEAFFDQTPNEIDKLTYYLNLKDWKSLRSVAHRIKPSFAFMGIAELQETIKLIEEYANNETHLELLPEMIEKVRTICDEAIKEMAIEKELYTS